MSLTIKNGWQQSVNSYFFIYPLLQTFLRIRRHKQHNRCPRGIHSLVRNPSLTLQSSEVGGYMLITVGEADQTGLTTGGCSGKYAAEERGTDRWDCVTREFQFPESIIVSNNIYCRKSHKFQMSIYCLGLSHKPHSWSTPHFTHCCHLVESWYFQWVQYLKHKFLI